MSVEDKKSFRELCWEWDEEQKKHAERLRELTRQWKNALRQIALLDGCTDERIQDPIWKDICALRRRTDEIYEQKRALIIEYGKLRRLCNDKHVHVRKIESEYFALKEAQDELWRREMNTENPIPTQEMKDMWKMRNELIRESDELWDRAKEKYEKYEKLNTVIETLDTLRAEKMERWRSSVFDVPIDTLYDAVLRFRESQQREREARDKKQ